MRKQKEGEQWVICPECKIKLKRDHISAHMKRVHNKKIDNSEINRLEIVHKKRQQNNIKSGIYKSIICVLIIIFIIVIASIYVNFFSNNEKSNDSIVVNNNSYFVSIEGKGNYSSIQEAIDSASNNDIIYVSKGIYFENIDIKKPLELIGEDKNTTFINGNNSGIVINISADNVIIRNFTIMNCGSFIEDESNAGVKISSSYNSILNCNISSNNNYGLYLYGIPDINNNIINYNIFDNNKYGIFTFYAKNNNFYANTFTNNYEYGIYIDASSNDNVVSDNTFIDNNYAIRIKGSTINTIINNQIINNMHGLYFCCGAKSNIAYNNVFIDNTNWNANDYLSNTWDNGKIGNYWDDYTGKDSNGDGIGDTPYDINLEKADMFPLMAPNID